jgi:hypothetical protein
MPNALTNVVGTLRQINDYIVSDVTPAFETLQTIIHLKHG